jgi:hypothetical protein
VTVTSFSEKVVEHLEISVDVLCRRLDSGRPGRQGGYKVNYQKWQPKWPANSYF